MLSKCANPGCPATFRYLHEGRLFRFDTGATGPNPGRDARNLEYFWLCAECSGKVTLSLEKGAGVTAVPLPQEPLARARGTSAS
jgi:hypothetical protein